MAGRIARRLSTGVADGARALSNMTFDRLPILRKTPRSKPLLDLEADMPSKGTAGAADADVIAAVDADVMAIRGDFDKPDLFEVGPDQPKSDIRRDDGSVEPGPPQNKSMDDMLDDVGGDKSPFKVSNPEDPVSFEEIQAAEEAVGSIKRIVDDAEGDLKKFKRKAGLDPDQPVDLDTLKLVYGDDLANKINRLETDITSKRIKIETAEANLKIKRDQQFSVGDSQRVEIGRNGKPTVVLKEGGDVVFEAPDNLSELKNKTSAKQEIAKEQAEGLMTDEQNAFANTELGKSEAALNGKYTLNRYKNDAKNYVKDPNKPPTIVEENGELKIEGAKKIEDMPPKHRSAYRKMCDTLGLKSKGEGVDGPKAKNRMENPDGPRNRKGGFMRALLTAAAIGAAFCFFQNVLDCIINGELGDSTQTNMRKSGNCREIESVIAGKGEDVDVLSPTETDGGAEIVRKDIKGYSGRNRSKPFIIRDLTLHTVEMNDGIPAPGESTGVFYHYMHYPENSYSISNYQVPYVENTIVRSIPGTNEEEGQLVSCYVEINEDGNIGETVVSGCNTLPPGRVPPENVMESEGNLWKTHKDGDECTIEYIVHQSALECSLENILGETLRDFGELAGTVIEETADAVATVAEETTKGIFDIIGGIFGGIFGSFGVIIYIICGLICLIILYKLYKKFGPNAG